MADRTAANLFARIFRMLASSPTKEHLAWARDIWKQTEQFDFTPEQMCCDEAFITLGLARRRASPDGEALSYGPEEE